MDKNILELQKIIEKHPEKISNLTDIELVLLNSLYDKQIQELERNVDEQKVIFKNLIKKAGKKK